MNYHSTRDGYPLDNYTAELELAAAIHDYNANNTDTRRIMSQAGITVADLDSGTAGPNGGNYVTNVLNLAKHCFNR